MSGPSFSAARISARRSSTPSSAIRRALLRSPIGPSSSTIQRASSAGIRCSVPRITHVRATERSSNRAASTSAKVLPGRRARTPSAAAPASCACKAATALTVSTTPDRGAPAKRCAAASSPRARSGGRVRAMAKRSPMSSLQASRTLVKSPPELWAELSDLGSLARHLGEFGEIRITQVDPESRVEWEADRASGTVRLEPSGWGTRVVLTVDTPEPAADPEPEPEEAPWRRPKRSGGGRTRAPNRSRWPSRGADAGAVAEVEEPKRGFWARLFGRKKPEPVAPEPEPEPVIEEPEPVAVEPEPETPFGTIEWEIPEPVAEEEPEPEPDTPADPAAVLHGMLDTLGAAHHRPFSRS